MTKHFSTIELRDARPIDDRRVSMAVSSTAPVLRNGLNEVLEHTREAIDLTFLEFGRAPLLLDHDTSRQIGVVERVSLDEVAGKLRVTARFGKSGLANDTLKDVRDGIKANVSIGYGVLEAEDNGAELRVTQWRPMEISIVSIPADMSVGVGRSDDDFATNSGSKTMEKAKTKATKLSPREAADLKEIGMRFGFESEADEAIDRNTSLNEFRKWVLDQRSKEGPISFELPQERRTASEQFDLGAFIRAKVSGDWSEAQHEREISVDLTRQQRGARGSVVPTGALQVRAPMFTDTGASPLVAIDHRDDLFIASLGAASVAVQAGARVLPGLTQDISIPRETGRPAANWIAEGGLISEGNPSFDNVTLNATMLAANVTFTRQALMQGLPAIDAIAKAGITRQFGIALDAAALKGSGVAPEPLGIINETGINSFAVASAGAVTWEEVCDAWSRVASDNVPLDGSMAWIVHPDVAKILRTTVKDTGSGQFILGDAPVPARSDATLAGLIMNRRVYETTNQPANTVTLGRFSDLLIGHWGGVDIVVDEITGASTGVINIWAYMWADISVRHAESFCTITGI